ncbi:AAA family ATPase [Thermotoga profunda]|uniref:AAA family ATPase n=1 Tax=Thermotoga profunda TaxID=1508420 RepID=UPI000597E733|nr:AAA family ATPase [Thermotoga profunda]
MSVLKIKSLKITGFGKFHNCQVVFKDGVNVVFGPNESGKTTLYRFMVSGLGGLSEDELNRYKPWDFDEFGGSLIIEGMKEEEVLIQQPLLDRKYVESIGLLSDEEDIVELLRVDETIIARLKRKMAQLEEAERISMLLKRQPEFEERLLKTEKDIDEQIEILQKEIEAFQWHRHQLFGLIGERSKIESDLNDIFNQKQKLLDELKRVDFMITRELEKIDEQLNRQLKELQEMLDMERRLPIITAEEYTEIIQLHQKIENAEQKCKELEGKIEELLKKRSDVEKQMNDLKSELDWQEDIEKVKLRIKNFELSYRVLENKLEQLESHRASYRPNWEVFKREGDKILRSLEAEVPTSIELEMKQINNKLQFIESEISKHRSHVGLERVLSLVTLIFSAISVGFGLFISPVWFYISVITGAISGIFFFLLIRTMKKLEEEDEQKIKLQLEFRSAEKKKQSAIHRVLSAFGVDSLEELKKAYEEYSKWLNEDREMEKLEERVSLEGMALVSELHRFGARDIKDVPSVVLRLNEIVESLERKQLEYFLIQQSIDQVKIDLEKVKEDRSHLSTLYFSKISSLGLQDMQQLQMAFERNSKIEQIQHKIDQILRLQDIFKHGDLFVLAQSYRELAEFLGQKKRLEKSMADLSEKRENLSEKVKKIDEQISKIDLSTDIANQIHQLSLKKLEKEAYSKLRNQSAQVKEFLLNELTRLTGTYVEKFSRILKDLFGRFTDLSQSMSVEKDLSVRFFVGNQFTNTIDTLSRATLDQLLLCYKIALYNTLQPEDSIPLIIDNFLIRFDETRLEKAAQLLKDEAMQRQVIIFTSDQKLLKILGVEPVLVLKVP